MSLNCFTVDYVQNPYYVKVLLKLLMPYLFAILVYGLLPRKLDNKNDEIVL